MDEMESELNLCVCYHADSRTFSGFGRRRGGGGLLKVRETYLRDDVPCFSMGCAACAPLHARVEPGALLRCRPSPLYLLDALVVVYFLDVLDMLAEHGLVDVVLMRSVLGAVDAEAPTRMSNRLARFAGSSARRCAVFENELCRATWVKRRGGDLRESIERAMVWYAAHAGPHADVVVLTMDAGLLGALGPAGVAAMTLPSWVAAHTAPDSRARLACDAAMVAFEAARAARAAAAAAGMRPGAAGGAGGGAAGDEHLGDEAIEAGLRNGTIMEGRLTVSSHAFTEGVVDVGGALGRVLVLGRDAMCRAVHGDDVAVMLLPRAEWACSDDRLITPAQEAALDDAAGRPAAAAARPATGAVGAPVPTGRVVGVRVRRWRACVATLLAEGMPQGAARGEEAVIVTPMDVRIPRIRIHTRQAEDLLRQRILVAIDAWPPGSRYPDGHYVRTLGPAMTLEAEVAAMLIESETEGHAAPFPDDAMACLPGLPRGGTWAPRPSMLAGRRDLRDLLVFSVDPQGAVRARTGGRSV